MYMNVMQLDCSWSHHSLHLVFQPPEMVCKPEWKVKYRLSSTSDWDQAPRAIEIKLHERLRSGSTSDWDQVSSAIEIRLHERLRSGPSAIEIKLHERLRKISAPRQNSQVHSSRSSFLRQPCFFQSWAIKCPCGLSKRISEGQRAKWLENVRQRAKWLENAIQRAKWLENAMQRAKLH